VSRQEGTKKAQADRLEIKLFITYLARSITPIQASTFFSLGKSSKDVDGNIRQFLDETYWEVLGVAFAVVRGLSVAPKGVRMSISNTSLSV